MMWKISLIITLTVIILNTQRVTSDEHAEYTSDGFRPGRDVLDIHSSSYGIAYVQFNFDQEKTVLVWIQTEECVGCKLLPIAYLSRKTEKEKTVALIDTSWATSIKVTTATATYPSINNTYCELRHHFGLIGEYNLTIPATIHNTTAECTLVILKKPFYENTDHLYVVVNFDIRAVLPSLPKYKEFIEGSGEHGFIIFSLGSYFTRVPLHMAEVFARVFSELPQRVIWRYIGPRPRHLGNNTLIVDWIPQNDILGHPKARLMIYHGGLRGILEAIYHAVPLVVMPVIFDQASNAVKVKTKGIGRILNRFYATDENVREVITDVLVNHSYRDNIIKYSRIYKDTQSDPEETIVYWVEHILKHGGSHLRSRALQLNFIQLNSIDVLAFIGAILLVTTFLIYSCCIRCPSRCLKNRKSKLE
nr:UDP-glucuronosyltransferase 1-2-like [Lytechinus pictus]